MVKKSTELYKFSDITTLLNKKAKTYIIYFCLAR